MTLTKGHNPSHFKPPHDHQLPDWPALAVALHHVTVTVNIDIYLQLKKQNPAADTIRVGGRHLSEVPGVHSVGWVSTQGRQNQLGNPVP